MADETDWALLKQTCADNGTRLILRTETFGEEYRFAMSAVDRQEAVIYDIRANDDGNDPQQVITGMIAQAKGDWWNG